MKKKRTINQRPFLTVDHQLPIEKEIYRRNAGISGIFAGQGR